MNRKLRLSCPRGRGATRLEVAVAKLSKMTRLTVRSWAHTQKPRLLD